jgi:hypothetical protein
MGWLDEITCALTARQSGNTDKDRKSKNKIGIRRIRGCRLQVATSVHQDTKFRGFRKMNSHKRSIEMPGMPPGFDYQ